LRKEEMDKNSTNAAKSWLEEDLDLHIAEDQDLETVLRAKF
jgi:hypothetical protein